MCCLCVSVVPVLVFVVFWWPVVPVQCVCKRGTVSALLLAGARVGGGSSLAAVGWEGEHPTALKPTSFSFSLAACCVGFCFYLKAPSYGP